MAGKALKFDLLVDTAQFARKLHRADGEVERFGKSAHRGFSVASKAFAGATVALGAVVAGAKSAVDAVEGLGGSTIKFDRITGASAKTGSEWVQQAKARGIETKQLNTAFIAYSKQVTAANQGTKASVQAFKDLGVSQKIVKSGDFDKTIAAVSDGFSKLPDGANKAALAQKLFGRQAQLLMPLLQDGSKELNNQLGLVDKYGASIGGKTVEQVRKSAAAQRELKLAFEGVKVQIGTALLPFVDKLRAGLVTLTRTFSRKDLTWAQKFHIAEGEVADIFRPITKGLGKAFNAAAPKIIDALATAAPRAAGAFLNAFKDASPWGKVLTVAFLASKFGAFSAVGSWAAKKMIGRMVAVFAADKTLEAAGATLGQGAGTAAGTGMASRLGSRVKSLVPKLAAAGGLRGVFAAFGATLGIAAAAAFATKFLNDLKDKLSGITTLGGGTSHPNNNRNGNPIYTTPLDIIKGLFHSARLPGSTLTVPTATHPTVSGSATLPGGAVSIMGGVTASVSPLGRSLRSSASGSVVARAASTGTYSHAQLAHLWIQAGGDPAKADLAAAVAQAESGGHPNALNNDSNGTQDRGLWQINSVHGGLSTTNPLANAKAAVKISGNGTDFHPWTTYNSGAYQSHLTGGSYSGGVRKTEKVTVHNLLDIAKVICAKFDLRVTSGYRTPEHNAAIGGAPNSWHMRGTPSNPGAVDMAGTMPAMQAALVWVRANVNGLAEAMIDDVGNGPNLHIASAHASLTTTHTTSGGGAAARQQAQRIKAKLQRQRQAASAHKTQIKGVRQQHAAAVKAMTPTIDDVYQDKLESDDIYDAGISGDVDTAKDAVTAAAGTADPNDDIAAAAALKEARNAATVGIAQRGITLQQRLAYINKQLKRQGLTPAHRHALKQEKAQLVGDIKALGGQFQDIWTDPDTGTADNTQQQQLDATVALTAQLKDLTDAQTADTNLRAKIFGSQTGQVMAAIADMVSGQLGGRVGLGIQTPGFAGGGVRY